MRWDAGLVLPMNVARSEMIRWAELTDTLQSPGAYGWDFSQRAYIETAMNALSGFPTGVTLAAAMVPMYAESRRFTPLRTK